MVKNKLIYSFLITSIMLLLGCSWQEYFVVNNNTDKDIEISYQIKNINGSEFAIFETIPTIYKLKKTGAINWEQQLTAIDNDTSLLNINVSLPPFSVLIFGNLNNDSYINKNQKFINGRKFNFNKMIIIQKGGLTEITLAHFDRFFKKEKGKIKYDIQKN